MFQRIISLLGLSAMACIGYGQSVQSHEYWFDSSTDKATIVQSTDTAISLSLDIKDLTEGIHYLNFRAQGTDNVWSTLNRYLFFIPTRDNKNATLKDYEYWIDADVASKKSVESSEEDVAISYDISSLSEGIHYFNFRSRNTDEKWGALTRYLFFIPTRDNKDATLTDYEYWIDTDVVSKKSVESSEEDVAISYDISTLTEGIHYFNFRSRNTDGKWGALTRYLFFIPTRESKDVALSEYEYWIDSDMATKKSEVSTAEDLAISCDISTLTDGVHYFNFRAKNSDGRWGVLNRYIFFKPTESSLEISPIAGYKVQFGSGAAEYTKVTATNELTLENLIYKIPSLKENGTIDTNCKFTFSNDSVTMNRSANMNFSMQFVNARGQWGAPICESIAMEDTLTYTAQPLAIQGAAYFKKMSSGDFAPFKISIESDGSYYFKASQPCTIDLYQADGTLYKTMTSDELLKVKQLGLYGGTYYGIVHDAKNDSVHTSDSLTVRLLLTEGYVPMPTIEYENGKVSISCTQEGASIYYTTDGTTPSTESTRYTNPFVVDRNCQIMAIATYEDLSPSDVATYKVDAFKVETPNINFANLQVYITCETTNTTIYYTTDGSDPATNGTRYTEPFTVTSNCTVKAVAKRDGYNNSDIATMAIDIDNVKCVKPTCEVNGNSISISSITDGVTIYYTTDGSEPTTSSTKYEGAFEVEHNCTIKAIAVMEGNINSDVMTFEVNWFQVATPTFSHEGDVLTISCATPNASIYYNTSDSIIDPSFRSIPYEGPITLKNNRTIRAIAYAENFNPSEIAKFTPNFVTCSPTTIEYNGRYVTMSTTTEDARIYYTTDGTNPTEGSTQYESSFDVGGLITIKTIVCKDSTNNSEMTTYVIPCYYDGSTAKVSEAGSLSKAFEWTQSEAISELTVTGNINATDLTTIKGMAALKHLDIEETNVDGNSIAERAFEGMNLISIRMPKNLTDAGSNLFASCNNLAAIVWSTTSTLPSAAFDGIANPNLLLYVRSKAYAPSSITNVVVGGEAESITLHDGEGNTNFYCPEAFTAKSISYTHNYSMETVIGSSAGWETIALPFDVSTISHSVNGSIAPFAANDADKKPFWLYKLTESGFEAAEQISANTPYIISMPNNDEYSDEYILAGNVTFSAQNATIAKTTQNIATKGDFNFIPTMAKVEKSSKVHVINKNEQYETNLPGSIFVPDLRDASPFEAYISMDETTMSMRAYTLKDINNGTITGIDELNSLIIRGGDTNVFSDNGVLYIDATKARNLKIYSTSGIAVKEIRLKVGRNVVSDIEKGVYIIDHKKVIIK